MMKAFEQSEPTFFSKLKRVYILIDNVEELILGTNFLSKFYKACKTELKLKFTFIFCGNNLKAPVLNN